MGHIFISYSHNDKEYVHKLRDVLKNKGFEVWIDDHIDYGTEWPKIIQEHIDDCDAFVVVVSRNASETKWVQNELARASRKKKPLFPLLLNGEPWITVEATQYVDVTDGSLPSERFYEHLKSVTSSTQSKADELFREAFRHDVEGDTERALQLYKQVKEIDPYYRYIDSHIRRLENERKEKGYVDQDGRVHIEKLKRLEQFRKLPPRTLSAILVFFVAILLSIFAIRSYLGNLTHPPTISISNDVRDINGNPIDMNSAPFQVKVSGTVSNADGYYVYLIVADKYHHYVEPGLGLNVSNEFSNVGQLGTTGVGFGQQYTIYAVVTDKPYTAFAFFDGESYIAKSKELKITREPMPTPTPTP